VLRAGRQRLALLALFAASRLAYYAAGVRFDDRPLNSFYQIFDPDLLQHRLAETLFYAHSQPPGFNLIVGLLLKIAPGHFNAAAHTLYIALGVFILLALYQLMLRMDVPANLAAVAAGVFMITPGVVLYENLLMYEYPLLALVIASALAVWNLFRRPRALTAFTLFALTAALVLTRSLFQLPYLFLIVAAVLYFFPGWRARFAAAAALPLVLATGLYIKNWVLYGQFASSTWMGFALYTVTIHHLQPLELDSFISENHLSPMERLPPLAPLSVYAGFVQPDPPSGIAVLDQPYDLTGRSNFNNRGYLQIQRIYSNDARFLLLNYPVVLGRSLIIAAFTYFLPTGDFPFFGENRKRIHTLDRVVNAVMFGQLHEAPDRKVLRDLRNRGASVIYLARYTGLYLLIGLPILFVYGCLKLSRHRAYGSSPANALLAFMLLNIAMLTVVVNLLSSFENNRYRLPVDGFFVILGAMALTALGRKWKGTARPPALQTSSQTRLPACPPPAGITV
jgi:hypothetical protein